MFAEDSSASFLGEKLRPTIDPLNSDDLPVNTLRLLYSALVHVNNHPPTTSSESHCN